MESKEYHTKSERAKELQSSAYLLVGIGSIGLIFIGLHWFGVISLPVNEMSRYMITIVLGTLFLFFIGMGMKSGKDYGAMKLAGEQEKETQREVYAWCRASMSAELITQSMEQVDSDENEEVVYFHRTEEMKRMIQTRYMNLEEGLFDQIVDTLYGEFFPE